MNLIWSLCLEEMRTSQVFALCSGDLMLLSECDAPLELKSTTSTRTDVLASFTWISFQGFQGIEKQGVCSILERRIKEQ